MPPALRALSKQETINDPSIAAGPRRDISENTYEKWVFTPIHFTISPPKICRVTFKKGGQASCYFVHAVKSIGAAPRLR